MFNSIRTGFINLKEWCEIVWKDRDWDYYYFCKLLQFKLKKMEKYFRKYGNFVGSEDLTKEIQRCVILLEKIIRDEYKEICLSDHDKKWGEIKMTKKNDYLVINRKNVNTDEEKGIETKEFLDCIRKANDMKVADINLLFDILKENLLNFWD